MYKHSFCWMETGPAYAAGRSLLVRALQLAARDPIPFDERCIR